MQTFVYNLDILRYVFTQSLKAWVLDLISPFHIMRRDSLRRDRIVVVGDLQLVVRPEVSTLCDQPSPLILAKWWPSLDFVFGGHHIMWRNEWLRWIASWTCPHITARLNRRTTLSHATEHVQSLATESCNCLQRRNNRVVMGCVASGRIGECTYVLAACRGGLSSWILRYVFKVG
jgi:hypothetical protein